jgi:predicted kinase
MVKRKFILIYGPPASGKLTVARELQKLTGYKLIHNHMSANVASKVFDFGTKEFMKLNNKIQFSLVKEGIKKGDLIFTKAYIHEKHKKFLRKLEKELKKNGFEICFVRLASTKEALLKRVGRSSRKKEGKLTDKRILADSLDKISFEEIPKRKSLIIDNSKVSARKVAQKIRKELRLK